MEEVVKSVEFLNSLLDKSDETLGAFARVEIKRLHKLVAAQPSVQRTAGTRRKNRYSSSNVGGKRRR